MHYHSYKADVASGNNSPCYYYSMFNDRRKTLTTQQYIPSVLQHLNKFQMLNRKTFCMMTIPMTFQIFTQAVLQFPERISLFFFEMSILQIISTQKYF